jgi:HK97 family phage major capsid protein
MRDLVRVQLNRDDTGEALERLRRHAQDVATSEDYTEYRDLSRVDGSGGYAVPPAWLMDQYIELARPGRAFANLVQRQPLPGGTDSLNIPKLLTGTSTAIQAADNQPVTDVDLTDTFINAPVRTISGQQGVALQLIDQSPIAFDEVVFRDLVADYAAQVDRQVLYGTGTNGQVLGVDLTPGITTIAASAVTTQGVYSAIANAVQTVHTSRFLPPEVIVMHPRRWGWFLSLLDQQDRPLFLPAANSPMNVAGVLTDVASQQVVGQMHGLPVVTDPNISTTSGPESPTGTEDIVYVPARQRRRAVGVRCARPCAAGNEGAELDGAASDLRLPGLFGCSLPAEHRGDHRPHSTDILRSLLRPLRSDNPASVDACAATRPPSWHRLGPLDMPLEAKRCRHVAVEIPEMRVRRGIAVSPRQ